MSDAPRHRLDPDRRTLRQFGFIGCAAFGLLAAWVGWQHSLLFIRLSPHTASWWVAGLASCSLIHGALAIGAPQALRPIFVGMTLLTMPIGAVVSTGVLIALYFGVLMPAGWLLRAMGRDPLRRRSDPRSSSCWQERTTTSDPRRYYRQY